MRTTPESDDQAPDLGMNERPKRWEPAGALPPRAHRTSWARRGWLLLGVCLITGVFGPGNTVAAAGTGSSARPCDTVPTGTGVQDYFLDFTVPPGLMPDPRFDGRAARIHVHRVRPVYSHGKCSSVPNRAAVMVHGATITGPAVFDVRHRAPGGGSLSAQRALAGAGIDTFAPSLLGFGRSTRFEDGLDDPGNASLRPYLPDCSCPHPEGCDRTEVPFFPLDQQGSLLLNNPLDGQRRAHSSNFRFARVDTFVRDIRQVIDDAIARAKPADGKVTLLGWSFGGQLVARTLYAANPVLPDSAAVIAKVNRAVFQSSAFGNPTEEVTPPAGFTSFPLRLGTQEGSNGTWAMPPGRDAACTGHIVANSQSQLWTQLMEEDGLGSTWGGDEPEHPTGLVRAPSFSSYGWNTTVARQLTTPALVIHGLDDTQPLAAPSNQTAIYDNLLVTNKVLVQVQCASHALLLEGCSGPRCTPQAGTPYGGRPGRPWSGPHATYQAALIEWITNGTFDGAANGHFIVNESGVANPVGTTGNSGA
ncbi:alpha/beta fold hydrolase [Streptomyces sp. NPDC015661]|uniref:alpha/beta fold hydrolase n=1 Tax=Streptomyces sp. NPDC015661 TaxID=3364961 RepID=UPI0036FE5849